jgi:dipeptidyl aminopeptidase/acylaminoacyl peptidase
LVHGGPWVRDTWGLDNEVQWLANRGYAVLQINYRGSTGYGKDYLNAGDREWGAKMSTDLLDGKAWMAARGTADPARVGIMGGSYGGYAVLAALAFTPEEFACGVDIVGPSILRSG